MRNLLTYSLILTAVIVLTACRKNKHPLFNGRTCPTNCYTLIGKVIDSAANTGLSTAAVKFYFRTSNVFFSSTTYLGGSNTDAAGNYRFTFEGTGFNDLRGYYYAEVYKGNFFHDPFYGNRVSTFYLDSALYNTEFIQNFSLFRPAYLKLKVIANNVPAMQSLTILYDYGRGGGGIILNGGRAIDTTLTFKTAGDLRTFISAVNFNNGSPISKKDTIFINSNTTRQHEIKF